MSRPSMTQVFVSQPSRNVVFGVVNELCSLLVVLVDVVAGSLLRDGRYD